MIADYQQYKKNREAIYEKLLKKDAQLIAETPSLIHYPLRSDFGCSRHYWEFPYILSDTVPLELGRLYTREELETFGFFFGALLEDQFLIHYPNSLYAINIAHPIYKLLKTKKETKPMFNRFTYTYEQAKPLLAEIERYLAAKAHKLPECDNPYFDSFNIYISTSGSRYDIKNLQGKQIAGLIHAGWMQEVPWSIGETAIFVHKQANIDGSSLTLSKTHVRLPQLSHLITLTPQDFFLFFQTLANQRNLLSFELTMEEIPEIFQTWFSPYYKGVRINSHIADRKWVPRYVIDTIAAMTPDFPPEYETDMSIGCLEQLSAMQYITVMRDDSLVTVPAKMMIDLELDWNQIKDQSGKDTSYCITEPDNQSFVLLGK